MLSILCVQLERRDVTVTLIKEEKSLGSFNLKSQVHTLGLGYG